MADSLYRIEVSQEFITPVTVTASSEREAQEKVMQGQGEAGDPYPGEVSITKITLLER